MFRTIDPNTGEHANIPAWLVVDAAYVSRYSIGGTPAGQVPSWATSAGTLADLATACGIDPDGLTATVAEFNRHAANGRDPLFHRGESAQDRYLGDPRQPHPCSPRSPRRRTTRSPSGPAPSAPAAGSSPTTTAGCSLVGPQAPR